MDMRLDRVPLERREVIDHLMQFYLYDFTQYLNIEVNDNGLFPAYPGLDSYWSSGDDKVVFLIKVSNRPAGFALIDQLHNSSEGKYYMTEFFIMKKYRRGGVGTWAAHELFNQFKGSWKVTQVKSNTSAQVFWQKVIRAYTDGQFRQKIHPEQGNLSQYFHS